MATQVKPDRFYDSEAALRLVDTALEELHAEGQGNAVAQPVESTPDLLLRTYGEIKGVLSTLRKSRLDIAEATVQKIQATQSKLSAVTSATEVATIDILDGLDRAQTLVDELSALDPVTDTPAAALRDKLRDELFQITGSLQFQDITTQQLNHASSVLVETETRLQQLAELFYPAVAEEAVEPAGPVTFDPAATVDDAGIRQALADKLFAV